ncbi:transporter substrate-binding domain-containing protein [Ammoniphilus sp. 3BR4]|uniref:transporter substrate-binding domain-containing protein n=1 Tax=Ammoniphilus sp. 3BR4 TaxID=3158265 RepID=UPI003466FE34
MKKWLKPLLLWISAMVIGVGCTSKDASTTPPPSENQREILSPTGQQQEKESLTFAMTGQFKPFHYEQDGKLVGFDVEIGEEVAKRLGMEPNPVKVAKDTLLDGLEKGDQYDAVIGSLSITPQRMEAVSFTKPYYYSGAQIFIKADHEGIMTVDDLKDKKVGAIDGTAYYTLSAKYSKKAAGYPDYPLLLKDLSEGKLDAVIMDRMMGYIAIKEKAAPIKPLAEPLYRDEIGIAVKKDETDLLQGINKVLDEMMADGTFAKISVKWFGMDISK